MTAWVDSHCHLYSLSAGADAGMESARAAGVSWVVCVGTDLETSRQAVEIAERHPDVVATVGLHPHDASRFDAEWPELRDLAAHPRVVAIGEAGFDLHYEHSPRDAQERAFREQVRLAQVLDRTLVIHSREAWDDTFRVLEEEGVPTRTVMHCFTGGPREAERSLAAGASLSFSGIVTFKNAQDVRDALALTPVDRVLVETDAPYLAPEPHRGAENEPALIGVVGERVAGILGMPVEEFALRSAATTSDLFRG